MQVCSFFLAALAVITVMPAQVHADDSVESRIRSLEETVHTLERRVASLEAQLHDQSALARVPPNKLVWRKLRRGMSQADVEALLGSPAKVDNYGSFAVWHYGDGAAGEVQFETNSEKVTGWHEPD